MSYRSFSFLPNIDQNSVFSNRFNQIDKIFSTLTGEKPLSDTPAYNLFQIDEHKYELILSIPGYEEKELDISVHNSQLTVQGKKQNQENDDKKIKKYLHKGIIFNDFSLNFNFDHKIQVKKAELFSGLLKINFECRVPDEEKPKKIFINIPNKVKEIEKNKI
ncbi:Hsp20 family protein [Buchnera aphidicola]|uniref:Small heat shock protein ibp n=1 Tax=Buchnera aphidicola subsp. Schizaphis graminum (strain Sg) TaxID=198804 RepID=IBP_BUCAP|nr:Hsp20 family protein [Buchnera aphidicola]Q9Z616.1 RecName: Full=Small heat shock protein ibp [Buchnera aphidicola str. Sg (Schizaphis graminum)]AAD19634.1 heat inducible protein Ibp [Buchnera aphidicola]AWI49948.1 heat-shock protein IbpA [Buchnera aphidicola (Schizaphis graminum)]